MSLSLLSRYAFFAACVLFTLASLPLLHHEWLWPFTLATGVLSLIGVFDLLQQRHAVRRNYPILGNIRYLVEAIRPEIRQYLLESDSDALPFSRAQRSLVYARAKNEASDKPFGTLIDVYESGFEFIGHSMRPAPLADPASFRVTVGGPQCTQPYSASIFNISAMSFGSLSANAIRALNQGAKLGNFAHDTGEGSISPYHREHGGDLTWELGSGYFGCRTPDGRFDPERFAAQAQNPQVRMIEIKMSQGAKPGHGGILPKHKVTQEIAETRGILMGEDCISPSRHSAFSTPIEMMQFIAQLRELSGGKPVGFKFCLGHPWEFMGIAKAMLETGILPDFIVVDGKEGGTGAAPVEFTDHIGVPLRGPAVRAQHPGGPEPARQDQARRQRQDRQRLRHRQRAGHRRRLGQLGARLHVRHRLHPVAKLPHQQMPDRRRHPGPLRQRALVVPDKAQRVLNFHRNTLRALAEMLAAAGLEHPAQLEAKHLVRRMSATEIKLFSQMHVFLAGGVADRRGEWAVLFADVAVGAGRQLRAAK
jgi:glutamate synthase domain-containing protein 2